MKHTAPMHTFRTPLTPAYWQASLASLRSLNLLVFAALMVAASIALSAVSVPVTGYTKFTLGFLARSLCALVCGPVMGLTFGFVEDMLGFILHPTGAFFPGYTLSTMLGVLVYALCFYRAKITVWRIALANVTVNVLINAVLGSYWNVILRGNGFLFYFWTSLAKNLVTVLPKVLLMYVLFQALLPVLMRMGIIPRQVEGRIHLI